LFLSASRLPPDRSRAEQRHRSHAPAATRLRGHSRPRRDTTRKENRINCPMHEYPYWWDTAPALRTGSLTGSQKLEVRSQKCDVAVVGAGYTGLAAARH